MICPRCLNEDPTYFYRGSKGYYCRKCIRFKRILLNEDLKARDYAVNSESHEYRFAYDLTPYQKKASALCNQLIQKNDVLLYCVCGAGKTEIVIESIASYLKKGLKVAYAIPRKEVVKELTERFKKIFPQAKIVSLYGGHTKELFGDLIICTTHQLYRYYQTFDLLILDEADAFPFKGDIVLQNIAKTSLKGHIIYSTATIDEELNAKVLKGELKEVSLPLRPHLKPLPIPAIIIASKIILLGMVYKLIRKNERKMIVFVSSKKAAFYLYKLFKHFFKCIYVYSDLKERDQHIKAFREGDYDVIFATTVLERGVTIPFCDVIILPFHQGVFDEASLIQMAGRVGRTNKDPQGKVWILSPHYEKGFKKVVSTLRKANEDALSLLRSGKQ